MNDFFRRLPVVAALLAVVCLCCACPLFAADDFAAEVPRVEDGGKPYLTVFGDVPFNVAELKALHPNAHFRHVKTTSDPIASRYAATVGQWPAVVYQEPDGSVIFKASGKDVPRTAQEVASVGFTAAGGRCRPFRPEPEPTPSPVAPPAPPVYEPTPSTVPDTVSAPDESENTWVYLVIFGAVAGITAVIAWAREIRGE